MESKKYEDFENEAKQYRKILQDYKRTRRPFTDPNFHPTLSINEREVTIDSSTRSWKRVDELSNVPLFQKDLINPDFVQQGVLGDCYFLSALSRIAKQPYLVPLLFDTETPDHIMGKKRDSINIESGAVVIYFNCFGRKTPVLIDTLLPTKNGRLIYSHPVDNSKSAWFCLVEKAYAKLNGSYSDIIGGTLSKAIYSIYSYYPSNKEFEDLNKPEKLKKMSLFDRIMKYQKKGAVMGTAINLSKLKRGVTENEISRKGLIPSHCYLLLKAREHDGKRFFCLRNPWGDHEWNGDYSDESPKWTPSLKEGLGWRNADDGTFWMADYDFFKYFTCVETSLPLRPEWYSRHYDIQIRPGDHDGCNVDGKRAKIAERPNYAFQVIDPIKKGEKCRFHILVEKRQKLFDDKNNILYKAPKYCVVLAHSNGKKLSPEVLDKSSTYTMSSSNSLLCFAYEVTGNDDIITIVIHRLQKCNLIEDCYVQIFCEKDFKLYDIDSPDELIPEDVTNGIVFDNFSVKHPKVANPLKIKRIKSKNVLTFGSMTGNDFEKLREELNSRSKNETNSNTNEELKERFQSRNKQSEDVRQPASNVNDELKRIFEARRRQTESVRQPSSNPNEEPKERFQSRSKQSEDERNSGSNVNDELKRIFEARRRQTESVRWPGSNQNEEPKERFQSKNKQSEDERNSGSNVNDELKRIFEARRRQTENVRRPSSNQNEEPKERFQSKNKQSEDERNSGSYVNDELKRVLEARRRQTESVRQPSSNPNEEPKERFQSRSKQSEDERNSGSNVNDELKRIFEARRRQTENVRQLGSNQNDELKERFQSRNKQSEDERNSGSNVNDELKRIFEARRRQTENVRRPVSNQNENFDSGAACYLVISPIKIKNLVYNGRPANNSNTLVRFTIDGKSYQTETVSRNANPEFKEIVIPIKDLKIGGNVYIDILHGPNQYMTKMCSSMMLPLNGMEINPLNTYSVETTLESDQNSGKISFSSKLLLKEDLDQSRNQSKYSDSDNDDDDNGRDSNYILEFTVNEASCNSSCKNPQVSISLDSSRRCQLVVQTNKKYQLNISDPKSEIIYFYINDDDGDSIADTNFVQIIQVSTSANSILDTELTLDDEVIGHLNVTLSLTRK